MKKGFWRGFIIGSVIIIGSGVISFSTAKIVTQKTVEKQNDLVEIGMKISDLKWLARAGEISEEELTEFQKSASNLSVEEANQLLDELLEGKEEEYLEKQEVLLSKIQSALKN